MAVTRLVSHFGPNGQQSSRDMKPANMSEKRVFGRPECPWWLVVCERQLFLLPAVGCPFIGVFQTQHAAYFTFTFAT